VAAQERLQGAFLRRGDGRRNSRNRLIADDQAVDIDATSAAAAADSGNIDDAAVVSRLELMPDEVCPICQEEMTSDMPLTYCR
jgi:chromosome condensin MukBEF MukE localization factor